MNALNKGWLVLSESTEIERLDYTVVSMRMEIAELRKCENQIRQLRRDTTTGMESLKTHTREELQHAKDAILEYVGQVETDNKQLRERLEDQETAICILQKLVDDQREMMEVMWNAPGMPGGQETIQRIKKSVADFFVGGTHLHDRENGGLGIK